MIYARDFLDRQTVLASASAPAAPSVSVILPTYKRCQGGLLERSIRSVLAQRFGDFELLVMDDGSTDGSAELIEDFRAADPRVIHVRAEINSGLPGLRVNAGIELARGEFLAFQFDDDMWRENALEDLVAAARRQSEPAVIVGRAQISSRVGKGVIPSRPVDIVALMEMNRLANNSVLLPREFVERYGMYDPHIGMRRLTDWDLWLRLIRHVPFITLDSVVAEVFESNADAIGVTVPWDLSLFRFLHSIPRSQSLLPSNWRDYPVDALNIGDVELPAEFRRRLYEEQIVPFYLRHRWQFPGLGGFSATLPAEAVQSSRSNAGKPKTVLYTKASYDVSNEVTFGHYRDLAQQRGSYTHYYQTLGEVSPHWTHEADLAILMRSVEDEALDMLAQAQESGRPLGLYLDDDLFTFHEYGPNFAYLAPGAPLYQNLCDIAAGVDAVLCTNDAIANSARLHNPRILPHNNTLPAEALPAEPHPRGRPVRIAYAGSGYRLEEFRQIWPALERLSREYGAGLEFEFWGLDVSGLPKLASPVTQRPFTFSYPRYLEALSRAKIDILLTPLLDRPAPRLAKSLIKVYETAVAGALGIFSDVPQYAALPGGLTCLKAANDPDSWYTALRTTIEMDAGEFDRVRRRCIAHVREEYSVPAQIDLHEAALQALEFHARTRGQRAGDGKPRVVYVLHSAHYGGAEIQLWRRLRLMGRYGVQPVVVIPSVLKDSENARRLGDRLALEGIRLETVEYTCFTEPRSPAEFFSELERGQVRALLERVRPALVHTVTFIPSFGQVCQEMNIPHVATLYAVQDDFAWQAGRPGFQHCNLVQSDCLRYARRWGALLETPHFLSRDTAPEELFRLGQERYLRNVAGTGNPVVAGIAALGSQIPGSAAAPPSTMAATASAAARLIATGTFQERKQQLETIEAAGRLKKEGYRFRLAFYGYTHFFPEYVEKCRQAIRKWRLEEDVTIHDFTEDLESVLGEADALLSLSTYESFPGSIKDALAAGVLVVATPVGGVGELIVDGVSGVVCRDTTVEALVEGLRRMLRLPAEERRRMAEQGRRLARLELHPYRTANDLFRMYNQALAGCASAPVTAVPSTTSSLVPLARARRAAGESRSARVQAPIGPPASLFPIGAGVAYRVQPARMDWCGLDVMVEPHGRPVSGRLSVRVTTPGGNLLRQASCELNNFREAGWAELRFNPIKNSAGRILRVEISFHSAAPGAILSVYQSSPPPHRLVRMVNRGLRRVGMSLKGGGLHCQLWYP